MILISLKALCVILAAICKALSDTISPRKGSRLSKRGDFWDIKKQGKFLPLTKYPLDGWHLCNSGMICMFIIAAAIPIQCDWWIEIPAMGVIFIIAFNFVFNKILR